MCSGLFDASQEIWRENKDKRFYFRILRIFKVSQLAPLLMAGYRHLGENDFTRTLILCVMIFFRYNVIGKLNTNELEKVYNQAAVGIHRGEIQTPAQPFMALKAVYVSDEKFEQDFTYKSIKASRGRKLIRYILAELEQDFGSAKPDFAEDPGTIEHILPENPGDPWTASFPFEVQESFIYRLGNYTLLEKNINLDVGNGSYAEKIARYSESRYQMTRAIQADEWNMDALTRRQEKLARRAIHIWRADFTQ